MIEQKRYQKYTENINNNNNAIIPTPTPNDIVQLTKHSNGKNKKHKKHYKNNSEPMNWWDQPFRDYLRSAKRPIIRETGIDQFAAEYMLNMLRDREQKVLKQRQEVEYKRTRKPIKNWYSLKGSQFGKEFKRYARQNKL
eukprot:480880_1